MAKSRLQVSNWAPILSAARSALREVERRLVPSSVQTVAEAIAKARQVFTSGLSGSAIALAEEALYRLLRYEVNVVCCPEAYFMRMTAAMLSQGDVVLAIALSGRSEGLIEAVNLVRGYGVTTIHYGNSRPFGRRRRLPPDSRDQQNP